MKKKIKINNLEIFHSNLSHSGCARKPVARPRWLVTTLISLAKTNFLLARTFKHGGNCGRVDILTFKLYNVDREKMSQTCRHDFVRFFIVIPLSQRK